MRYLVILFISILLSACAATYKPAEDGVSGYRDHQVNETTFYVEYTESKRVSWKQVHDFALKRCAEITRQKGYKFFDVVDKQERAVLLDSNVDSVVISSMGNVAYDPPVSNSYQTGGKVEGRRVIYKIVLANE